MAEEIVQIYKDKEHLHKEYPITVPEAIKMPDGRTLALELEREKQKLTELSTKLEQLLKRVEALEG